MTDIYSTAKRSVIMSRIRSSGTNPEVVLHACLRQILGARWRIDQNVRKLPGQPDVVIPSLGIVIFVDGCFYHSCPQHKHVPRSNETYWFPKLQRNIERDKMNRRTLRKMGFTVWSFWEHDLKKAAFQKTAVRLKRKLRTVMNKRRDRDTYRAREPSSGCTG